MNTIFFIANESCLHNFQKPGNPERFEFFQIIFVSVWKNWKLFLSTKYKLFTVEEMKWASLSSYVSLELTLVIVICLQSRSTHSKSNGKPTLRLVHIVSISYSYRRTDQTSVFLSPTDFNKPYHMWGKDDVCILYIDRR